MLGNPILTTNPAKTRLRGRGHQAWRHDRQERGRRDEGGVPQRGIVASDRAFDFANRFNKLNDITLYAKLDINLSVTAAKNAGAANNTKAVVSTQAGDTGTVAEYAALL